MKKLIEYLSNELNIKNKDLLEKDILLHQLLSELISNTYFRDNFVFKGGTCLTKCYYGYFRFSEDLDFTWINQKDFTNKSQKEIRKLLSQKITAICKILQKITKKLNLDFKIDKSDRKYIELGGSNKFVTFKLWYKSYVSKRDQFIKIQINFLELLQYSFKQQKASSIIKNLDRKEFSFLFPEYKSLLFNPAIRCYNFKEILVEKFRAILTRKGVKARDFIDIFLICKKEDIDPLKLKIHIIKKTKFMLRYNKYIQNLEDFKLEKFVLGEEDKLLLKPINKGFEDFLEIIHAFLNNLAKELRQRRS